MTRLAVFGYASLVSAGSASATLGRPVAIEALARLEGWARRWSLARDNLTSEKSFARPDGTLPRYCLGLNLEPSPGAEGPNGALIELDRSELERLDLREIRYHRVDVTEAVAARADGAFDRIFTYTARAEHHHPRPPPDSIVIATYPATIEAAFAALGADQLAIYRATTAAPPVEVSEAKLVRDQIPAGNPRAW